MSHHADKKQKKLAQLLSNRRHQNIIMNEEEHARGRDLEKEREEELEEAARTSSRSTALKNKQGAEPVWSARMQAIRDRNTGRERMAKERWNRFAGTESGGGRGL